MVHINFYQLSLHQNWCQMSIRLFVVFLDTMNLQWLLTNESLERNKQLKYPELTTQCMKSSQAIWSNLMPFNSIQYISSKFLSKPLMLKSNKVVCRTAPASIAVKNSIENQIPLQRGFCLIVLWLEKVILLASSNIPQFTSTSWTLERD